MFRASYLLVMILLTQPCAAVVTFEWAYVGNAGNTPDVNRGFGAFGSVGYAYRIGKHEVTNAQYAEFLNAVAATDSFGGADSTLYHSGGIVRSGFAGSYTYAPAANMATKPVTYISFFDAMRFTNWMHNGQGSGGTESGVYTIGSGLDEVRSEDARYWLPSQDEWYKAAYHQPASGGGDRDDYWSFPTARIGIPTVATANSVGDISNPGAGVINYSSGAHWDGQFGNVTTVGSAGPSSDTFYGTFDQGGNVMEWTEAVIGSNRRSLRGGSWMDNFNSLEAASRTNITPASEFSTTGFRVATAAPSVGDYNADGAINPADYDLWKLHFGASQPNAGFGADGNSDGVVDAADYTIWRDLIASASGATIPEPNTLALATSLTGWGLVRRQLCR